MNQTYEKATKIKPGVAICNVGYENCPGSDSYHWHCSRCGGISGQQGHYFNPDGKGWRFTCDPDWNVAPVAITELEEDHRLHDEGIEYSTDEVELTGASDEYESPYDE